jgi:hypothetical protein
MPQRRQHFGRNDVCQAGAPGVSNNPMNWMEKQLSGTRGASRIKFFPNYL